MDIKNKIIEQAEQLFQQYGFRSVTMDDIAKSLGLSKKTLYQYFVDKDDIVVKATQFHLERDFKEFEELAMQATNAIEEIFNISVCMRKNMHKTNPSVLYDLQKYYPKAWGLFLEYKDKVFKQSIIKTIKRGQEEGYFRGDINCEMLAILRMEQIQMSFDPKIFPPEKYDFKEVQNQFIDHFIHGLLTPMGRKNLEETITKNSETTFTHEN
uniref:TetR/AcrR family transcriptional regulator n=1 Tax=Fulvivirga sp. TaxID=1931237 RepID=UPI00404AD6CF